MRAILLASATITSMRGFRASMRPSHDPSEAPRRHAWLTTALAPMISRRRSVLSPIFDVAPSFCFPPVDRCSGVNPSHAAKSRPRLKLHAAGARATSAVAVTGPTPGIVTRRRACSSSRARRAISTSNSLICSVNARSVSTSTPSASLRCRWQVTFGIFYVLNKCGNMRWPLCHNKPVFYNVTAKRIDRLRALAHEQIAGPEDDCGSLLLRSLCRYEAHCRPLRRLADRFGIRRIVLLPFD